jgi:divalent metal cation (Fe/Co/Zn/Cd) transporter
MSDGPAFPSERLPRSRLLERALLLVTLSVAWGALSGGFALAVGLIDGSLAVLGVGLGVLADLSGSAVLIWRFRAERRHPIDARPAEARAGTVVAMALCVTSVVLLAGSVRALVVGSRPGTSVLALIGPGVTLAVLVPLAVAKRRVGAALGSPALEGDATLSAVGAAMSLLAIVGLLCFRVLGWWWADRAAALVVAAVAGIEAYRIVRAERDRQVDPAARAL